ncbi:unnamed protein product, partial [Effrenium voratum]
LVAQSFALAGNFVKLQVPMAMSRSLRRAVQARGMFTAGMPPGGRMPGFWVAAPNIVPAFRKGNDKVPVDAFSIDCRPYTPGTWGEAELFDRMQCTYNKFGVVRLTNTGLSDPQEMTRYARAIVRKQMKYEGGANPREGIIQNVFEVGAPNDAWLHYHHEMAYNQHSMRNLAFCSIKAAPGKGDTYLSENISVTDALMETDLGRKWDSDPLKPDSKRYMKTKLVISAFEYCPEVERNLLYSSIADHNMWFDTWQGVHDVPPEKRPLQMSFGDGTPFSLEELRQWVHLYDEGGIRVQWQTGDVLAFCNYRYAHGRPAFTLQKWEERQIGVVLGEKFQRQGTMEAKW